MAELRALDLFCGAGGATKGLQRAGFHVTGIDIKRQPRYCGDLFIQADALRPPVRLADFDLIWASPPCQQFSLAKNIHRGTTAPDLIAETRAALVGHQCTVIENVPGAPIRADIALTGCDFGLKVIRRRHFETSFWCLHPEPWKPRNAVSRGGYTTCAGHGVPDHRGGPYVHAERWRQAMQIDWMTRDQIAQAVPPAYAEFIGRAARKYLDG